MDSFTRREEGFERDFSRQEELRFKARARRDRALGRWAGDKLGLSGAALEDYANALAARGLEVGDDEALVADLTRALQPAGVSEHRIRRRIEEFGAAALSEIQAGR